MINTDYATLKNPVRTIKAKVELYNGSTLVDTFNYTDALKSIEIERVGNEGKFFGFVVSQKANIKLRDIDRAISITTANSFKVYFAAGEGEYIQAAPTLYVTEVNRDENTNELSITTYDALKDADKHYISEITITNSNTMLDILEKIAAAIGISTVFAAGGNIANNSYINFAYTVNFEDTENLQSVLTAAAEFLGAIMYLSPEDNLVVKGIANAAIALTIDKEDYIKLDCNTNRKLTTIVSATELGNNISATTGAIGTTQYLRDNPFIELREETEAAEIINNLIALLGNLTINQFNCSWRGNYLLEIGDKIELITKDNNTTYSYVINDKITYNGGLSQTTSWNYKAEENETASNPTNLGEALKQTYAKVDKANKEISLVASEVDANKSAIAALELNTESITASVSEIKEQAIDAIKETTEDIATLKTAVEAQITAEDLTIKIKEEMANGVNKVETTTGFTFDENGLTVEKTNSEMKTTITEDGMKVYKNDEAVLTADNVGVNARNLHAVTYLIIGTNSRFEDYGNRTGCFWIGGNS